MIDIDEPSARPSGSRAATSVLIVSSDPFVLEEARYGFPLDIEVVTTADSRSASRLLRDRVPDVVVIDLHTGSAGGFGLAMDMASDPSLARVPFVMLLERPQDTWLAAQAGAACSRTKPVAPGVVATDVLGLIGHPAAS